MSSTPCSIKSRRRQTRFHPHRVAQRPHNPCQAHFKASPKCSTRCQETGRTEESPGSKNEHGICHWLVFAKLVDESILLSSLHLAWARPHLCCALWYWLLNK